MERDRVGRVALGRVESGVRQRDRGVRVLLRAAATLRGHAVQQIRNLRGNRCRRLGSAKRCLEQSQG